MMTWPISMWSGFPISGLAARMSATVILKWRAILAERIAALDDDTAADWSPAQRRSGLGRNARLQRGDRLGPTLGRALIASDGAPLGTTKDGAGVLRAAATDQAGQQEHAEDAEGQDDDDRQRGEQPADAVAAATVRRLGAVATVDLPRWDDLFATDLLAARRLLRRPGWLPRAAPGEERRNVVIFAAAAAPAAAAAAAASRGRGRLRCPVGLRLGLCIAGRERGHLLRRVGFGRRCGGRGDVPTRAAVRAQRCRPAAASALQAPAHRPRLSAPRPDSRAASGSPARAAAAAACATWSPVPGGAAIGCAATRRGPVLKDGTGGEVGREAVRLLVGDRARRGVGSA